MRDAGLRDFILVGLRLRPTPGREEQNAGERLVAWGFGRGTRAGRMTLLARSTAGSFWLVRGSVLDWREPLFL
jgi:hypothetical protein